MLLHELFDRAVRAHAGQPAVDVPPGIGRSARQRLTYAELDRTAAALARPLAAFVAGEGAVAVLLPRASPRLYAAQLAILRVGAAHVCLEPSFPDEHLAHVLADAQALAVLTDGAHAGRIAAAGMRRERILLVDELLDELRTGAPAAAPSPRLEPPWLHAGSLAYVIYTSGTTGKPKGVMIEHRGAVNLIVSGVERFALGPGDRIAQGSSPAYDSAVEETWLALASGATVVALDDDTVRLGPDLVPWLRRERITVLCPPPTLLRAMDCRDPKAELPAVRLCYVGGEALPQDLADLWARDLWLENGYGPTECTVTVVRGRLRAGEPVTIGTPVPGHQAWILDARLSPVAPGQEGELCLAGVGLARGYVGQPDLTAQRFAQHAKLGRIYRTGDLARRAGDGRIYCLGRIDSQVKVRGYRIELEAIDAALAQCAGVREAACRVQDEATDRVLVAFVVPDAGTPPPVPADLEVALRAVLPPYMVPSRIGVLAALPRTVGGKLDRKALPWLEALDVASSRPRRVPRDACEREILAALAACLGGREPGLDDDFFALGGNSLRAARLISSLRRAPATASLTVRDVYTERTAAGLAARARAGTPVVPAATTTAAPVPRARPLFFTFAQLTWLLLTLAVASAGAWLVAFALMPWFVHELGLTWSLLLASLAGGGLLLAYTSLALWGAVLVKELLIGRYLPGRVPVWGWFHLRHWIVVRAARAVPWGVLQGTVLHSAALRALGARIGCRVHIHRGVDLARGGWDLLELSDDVMLGQEAHVGVVELADGHLVLGKVRLGAASTLDVRAGVGPDTEVGANAVLTALSFLPSGARLPVGERWDGVPAQPQGAAGAPPAVDSPSGRTWSPLGHGIALIALRLGLAPLLALPFTCFALLLLAAASIDTETALAWLYDSGPWSAPVAIVAVAALAVVTLPLRLLVQALLLRWSRAASLGIISRWSTSYLRVWLRTGLVHSAGNSLSGTLFWPMWLRLSGMRIGRDCEVSTILDVLPEHVEIGSESFFADGIYLGVPHLRAGTVTLLPTSLGARTFLGNHVVVHAGQRLPQDVLLGVCTVADARRMPAGSAWFGRPPFVLPQREVVTIDRRLTHEPTRMRYANRVFWEALRFVLPALPVVLVLLWFDIVGRATDTVWLVLPAASLGVGLALALVVLGLKWSLLGRVRPGQHALWSCWASRWDFLYVAWNRYGRALLSQLEGTLVLAWYLRAMGVKIGRGVVLGEGFAHVVDPDMLSFEDGATVQALFQAHSFEDRVLKIDRVRIGKGATVGRGTVILFGADVGEGAAVAPHSVVMKHEHLLPHRRYAGAPTRDEGSRAQGSARAAAAITPVQTFEPQRRDAALDVARGVAVLGMIVLHLVPSERTGGAFAAVCASAVDAVYGKPAALFAVLAGMAWAIQASHRPDPAQLWSYVGRRALALGVAGLALWTLLWPTEILLPLALMLPVTVALHQRGPAASLAGAAALLVAVPPANVLFGHFVAFDCLEDGTHLANHTVSWATLRYFLFDGSYPLLPWLALPLFGAAMVSGGYHASARAKRWFWLALPLALALQAGTAWVDALAEVDTDPLGALASCVTATWQPTSVPFALLLVSWAVAVIAGLSWWQAARTLPRAFTKVAWLGRTSLTHYVLHLLVVFAPLRLWWPAEDWPLVVGLSAAVGYIALAVPVTEWWLRRRSRGPFEALLARVSGAQTRVAYARKP